MVFAPYCRSRDLVGRWMPAPGRRSDGLPTGGAEVSASLECLKNQSPPVGLISDSRRTDCMCQSCVEIDKQVEKYRELLRSTLDQKEIERISRTIAKLYGDRVLLHRNPEQ
jgi:hypothetical protein